MVAEVVAEAVMAAVGRHTVAVVMAAAAAVTVLRVEAVIVAVTALEEDLDTALIDPFIGRSASRVRRPRSLFYCNVVFRVQGKTKLSWLAILGSIW